MKELEYPFDASAIISKKKSIRRKLLENTSGMITKKIAILGGYTTSNIKLIMELFLLDQGIKPEFYESEYNQFFQDAVFDNKELEEFAPDIIYVCTSNRNIIKYPTMQDVSADIDNLFAVGKLVGAEFVAHSALRVQKSCMSMAEGVAKYIVNILN